LVQQDGLKFMTEGIGVELPEGFTPPAALVDKDLVLGIRPEHVDIGGSAASAKVLVIENLGNETMVYFQIGASQFTVRGPGDLSAGIDQELGLSLRPDHIHFFDAAAAGRNLLLGD